MARVGSDRAGVVGSTNGTNGRAGETPSAHPSTNSAPSHDLQNDLRPAATAGRKRRAPHIETDDERACGSRPDESIVRDFLAHACSSTAHRPHGPLLNSAGCFARGGSASIPRSSVHDGTKPAARRCAPRRRVRSRKRGLVGSKQVPSCAEVDRQRVYLRGDDRRADSPPKEIPRSTPSIPRRKWQRATAAAGLLRQFDSRRKNLKKRPVARI